MSGEAKSYSALSSARWRARVGVEHARALVRAHYWKNKEKIRAAKQKRIFGEVRSCPKACEACGLISDRTLNLDHDHVTGKFRGWLCHKCNKALGLVGDNAEGVRLLLAYLEKCNA